MVRGVPPVHTDLSASRLLLSHRASTNVNVFGSDADHEQLSSFGVAATSVPRAAPTSSAVRAAQKASPVVWALVTGLPMTASANMDATTREMEPAATELHWTTPHETCTSRTAVHGGTGDAQGPARM